MSHVIDAIITLKDNFSATLSAVDANTRKFAKQQVAVAKQIERTGKSIEKTGKSLTKSITLPIIAIGAGLIDLAENFEKAQNTIRTTTGKTGKDLESLNNSFKNVYKNTTSNMTDTSTAVAGLNSRLGLTGKPLETLSLQILNLSRITKTDLATEIAASTRMFQDAGIKQADYGKALDYTFKVSQHTGIGVDRLQQLMTQFGGPLRQMGFDWKTSATMLGQFEKQGVNTELVVGSLRIALGKMAKQGIKDPSVALQTMIKKIKEAGSAGKANSMALSMFGAKAGPDMAAAIREGHMDLTGLLKILKNSPDTINKAAGDTATFGAKLTKMKHQMAVAFEPVATKLLDSLSKLIPALQKGANFIASFAKKIAEMSPKQQEMIVKFALMAAAVGPAIIMLGKIVMSVGAFQKGIGKLILSVQKAGGVLAWVTSPANLVVIAIIAVAVAAFLIIKYWGPISSFFKKIWNDILEITNKVWSIIGPTIMGAVKKIQAFWNSVWPQLKQIFEFVFKALVAVVGPYIALMYMYIKAGLGFITGFWKHGWDIIKDTIKFIWDYIVSIIRVYWDLFTGIFKVALDLLTGNWAKAWKDIKSIFINLWNDVGRLFKDIGKDALNWGKDIIKGLIDGIKGAIGGVEDAVKGVANKIKSFLHFSVPDEGPLRDYMTWMPDMLKGMSQGIKISTHLVTDKVKDVSVGIKTNLKDNSKRMPMPVSDSNSSSTQEPRAKRSGPSIILHIHNPVIREEKDIDEIATAIVKKLTLAEDNM